MIQRFTTAILAMFIILAFASLGGAVALGAHKWWALKSAMIGAPIGVFIGLVALKLIDARAMLIALFAGMVLASFIAAKFGQTQFAASYGDDVLAGKLWFFGWIGVMCFAAATLAALLTKR